MRIAALVAGLSILIGCAPPPDKRRELHVGAASNLSRIMPQVAGEFERQTGVHVVASYGSTAQLTRQIENGAPLDVFLAADLQHVEELRRKGHASAGTPIIYARGRVVIWAPQRKDLRSLADLASADVTTIAVARPELAPYGQAAVETMHQAGLWDKLEKKIVYAPNITAAKQMADTGNADVAFTAMALVIGQQGYSFPVNPSLYKPIEQGACVTAQAQDPTLARQFLESLTGERMRTLLRRYGYSAP